MPWQRWKAIRDSPQYKRMAEKVVELILPTDWQDPGYPRARVEPPIPSPFPAPYPAPSVVGDIWRKREPINYFNLNLPDGSTIPIIPLLRLPLVTPGTWTNDSPAAGMVSWTGCQIAHEGEAFEIDDGSTSDAYIYWDKSVSETAFQTSATKPTIDPTEDLLICFNDSGTAKLAFLSDLIQANLIACQYLSTISADVGVLTGGAIIAQRMVAGTGTKDADLDGIQFDEDGIWGQLAGVNQFYLLTSDGKAYFGAGAVTLDADGIRIAAGDAQINDITWGPGGGLANIFGVAGTPAVLVLRAGRSGDTSGEVDIRAYSGAGNYVGVLLNHTIDGAGYFRVPTRFSLATPPELTIASGVVAVTRSYHKIDTENDDAADDLDTINGGVDGQRLVLKSAVATRDTTIKDGTGNIELDGGVDFTLSNRGQRIELMYDSGLSKWVELSRSSN